MATHQYNVGRYTIDKRKLIGKGQYGLIYQATYDGDVYCVKILQRIGNEVKFVQREEEFLNELIKQPIQNPNLVYTYEVKEDAQRNEIYIIMEYCKGGDLQKEMQRKKNQWYTTQESVNIIAQIVRGYKTLYDLNFLHRDIKPANILISSGFYKLADFGMGRFVVPGSLSAVGTPKYTAPEIFFSKVYSNKCDVYSLGVLFYELIYKEVPINGKTNQDLLVKLRQTQGNDIKCPQNDNFDIRIKVLIEQMLKYDQNNRISWPELFNHQLFNGQAVNTSQNHLRRSSLLVNQQQTLFQKRTTVPYYHHTNRTLNLIQDAQSFNGLRHLAEFLMSKGDVAYDLACQLSEQHENILEYQQNTLQFCLITYKYFICINTMGICTNQSRYCHKNIIRLFPQFEELITQYSQSDSQDILLMKDIINQCLGYLNRYYRDLQQCVLSQTFLKEKHLEFYNQVDEHDQTDFFAFQKWFVYFYNAWFSDKIFPNSNQFNKVLSLETAFPLERFWEKAPTQIIRIRTNSL